MSNPSPQYASGGFVAAVPFDRPPVAAAAPEVTALMRRLESVGEELFLAEQTLHSLIGRLEPVLPIGFGQEPLQGEEHSTPPDGPSPLAERLSTLARRTHSVVRQLQMIAAAVDL